jgi:hypothetical protein
MRASVISDVDGSVEYSKVRLTPSNWAWLAKQKAKSGPKGETAESLTWKISRLQKVNLVLEGMIAVRSNPCPFPPAGDADRCGVEPGAR